MKILSLRLKNLNSLKGEWKVDFTAVPRNAAPEYCVTVAKRPDDPRHSGVSGRGGI